MRLLYVASFITVVSCTGYLEIRLKSDFQQDLKLLLTKGTTEFLALPIRLAGREERLLGKFPIDFKQKYALTLLGSKVEKLGINGSSYHAEFQPLRGSISPKQLHLPLSGLQLVVDCEEKWSGDKCDIPCRRGFWSDKCSGDLVEQDLFLTTDYTIDMEQLPTIVGRLKETTIVKNEIRKAEDEKKEETDSTKKFMDWKHESKQPALVSSIFDMFKAIARPREEPKEKRPWSFSMRKRTDDEERPFSSGFSPMMLLPSLLAGGPKNMASSEKKRDEADDLLTSMSLPISLMGLMPRLARHAEGSGMELDDFTADQIIKN